MSDKEIRAMILKVYKERQAAHKVLLECDLFIDKLLKELIGKKLN